MRRGEEHKKFWKDTFHIWYPTQNGDRDTTSVLAELTKLDPDVYREVVYEWPLGDFLIWLERSRVRSVFDDIS